MGQNIDCEKQCSCKFLLKFKAPFKAGVKFTAVLCITSVLCD